MSDEMPPADDLSLVRPLTPVASPIRSVSEATTPLRYLITPVHSRGDSDDDDDHHDIVVVQEEVTTCPKWSEVINSPTSGEIFSPSKELNKPGSLHGLGLMVATDRAKKLSQSGRRCATLLSDIAALQDTFAQSLLKSCQSLPTSPPLLSSQVLSVQRCVVSFAKQMQGLAICIRGSVSRPLHTSMAGMADTVPSIYDRYTTTRTKCVSQRQNALKMRKKYVKAIRDAEMVIQEIRQSKLVEDFKEKASSTINTSNHSSTNSTNNNNSSIMDKSNASESSRRKPWEASVATYGRKHGVSPDRLIALLNEVQSLEAQYRALVEEENQAVSLSVTMEIMALEALQKLEEERAQFFLESMSRTLQAEKGALDNMILSLDHNSDEVADTLTTDKKPKDFFKGLLKPSLSNSDEAVGLAEAEILGLPEDAGRLRDKVRASVAARTTRSQTMRALAGFLEDVAAAATALAFGINTRINQEGFGNQSQTKPIGGLAATLMKFEGARVLAFWNCLMGVINESADAARTLAETLRSIRQAKLDGFLLGAEKETKSVWDGDEKRWKQLCEAARVESKAQLRYQHSTSQFEKARDRVKSADEDLATSEHRGATPVKMAPGMSKALGNMFSILPNGGEHAMQMLAPDARRAIAQTSLDEADEREAKDRQNLEAATTAKTQALEAYMSAGEGLVEKYRAEDETGWIEVGTALESLFTSLGEFRSMRYDSVNRSSAVVPGPNATTSDMAEWTERARTYISRKSVLNDEVNLDFGFQLDFQPEEAKSVYKLLALVGSEGEEEPDIPEEPEISVTAEESIPVKDIDGLDENFVSRASIGESLMETLSSSTKELMCIADMLKEQVDDESKEPTTLNMQPQQPVEGSQVSAADKAETEVFLAHFWSDREEGGAPPTVIESFSCAYWPKEDEGYLSPILHGRMFVTSSTIYFVGWGEKKIVLDFRDMINVTKEKSMLGAIDNSLSIVYKSDAGESSYFFGSFAFRENAFQLLQQLSTIAKSLNEMNGDGETITQSLPDVPPDQVLQGMEVLLSKKIKNVSIQQFYDVVWSEGNRTDKAPFYGPWLEEVGSHNVKVEDWEFTEDGHFAFRNEWCGEKYSQKRLVKFEFTRKTHLYIGPPVAGVNQIHHCRVDNDKCIVAMTVEMEGIPYADCFAVEVRWVARRVGSRDIHVEVGVFVNFKKSTMFAKQIRAGTTTETKPMHHKLFEKARLALAALGEGDSQLAAGGIEDEEPTAIEEGDVVTTAKNPMYLLLEGWKEKVMSILPDKISVDKSTIVAAALVVVLGFRFVLSIIFRSSRHSTPFAEIDQLSEKIDELQAEMRLIQQTLVEVLALLKNGDI